VKASLEALLNVQLKIVLCEPTRIFKWSQSCSRPSGKVNGPERVNWRQPLTDTPQTDQGPFKTASHAHKASGLVKINKITFLQTPFCAICYRCDVPSLWCTSHFLAIWPGWV